MYALEFGKGDALNGLYDIGDNSGGVVNYHGEQPARSILPRMMAMTDMPLATMRDGI